MSKSRVLIGLVVGMLLWVSQGLCQPYYVDATARDGGNGSYAEPWNRLDRIVGLLPGDTVHLAGTFSGMSLRVTWSGREGEPVTFRQWEGRGPWKIDGGNAVDVCIHVKAGHVAVMDAELSGSRKNGFMLEGQGITGVLVENVTSRNNEQAGFYCAQWTDGAPMSGIVFKDCRSFDNGNAGFHHVGAIDGVSHYGNEAFRNGGKSPAHGFSSHAMRKTYSDTQWTPHSTNVYCRPEEAPTLYRVLDHTLRLELTENKGGANGLAEGEWARDGVRLCVNVGRDLAAEPHQITVTTTQCRNINYYHCVAHHNYSEPGGYVEGHGFAYDDYTSESTVYGCLSYANEGHGFMSHMAHGVRFLYSRAYDNGGRGINVTAFSRNADIFNNTVHGNQRSGIQLYGPSSDLAVFNNILHGNGEYGLQVVDRNLISLLKSNYNCFHGNVAGHVRYVSLASNDITQNPQLVDPANHDFRLLPGSPCIDSGRNVGLSRDGDDLPVPRGRGVDMGAFEFIPLGAPTDLKIQ